MPMEKIHKILLVFAAVMASVPAFAQSASIRGTLLDQENGDPLPYATLSIYPASSKKAEGTPQNYALSGIDGKVVVGKVRPGNYTMKIELMGYTTLIQQIKVESKGLDLGVIMVKPDSKVLEAATVTGLGNPIIVKKDTIEYNASSFKTTDNDMLIDLLKKLPGIEVESDGSITANGETVKKITIDGKTFFLDDPQLATKNIPSKIVEKIKVIEKKSDQAIFTGIDDGEEETIIDLNIKPGMINGWFGNLMGGGGHDVPSPVNTMNDWRWQGAGMIGRFTENSQLSVILNGNNTNNRGFNDMAGSMMSSIRGGGSRMGRGGGGWGGRENGITTSWMGGINGAWNLLDNRMELAGNYLYNGSNKFLEEQSRKQTFLDNGNTLFYDEKGQSYNRAQGHRVGVRVDHKFTENTSLLFEPQFNYGYGDYNDYSNFLTDMIEHGDSVRTKVNDGFTQTIGNNDNWKFNGRMLFRQRLGKPGRTISLNVNWDVNHNHLDGLNQSLTLAEDTSAVNQHILSRADGTSLSGNLVYTEPLYRNELFLEVNYQYGWNRRESTKDVYNALGEQSFVKDENGNYHFREQNNWDSRKDSTYSNSITNNYQTHRAGANLMYQKDKLMVQLGASFTQTITDNITNGKKFSSSVPNWSPQASVRYEINDNSNFRLFYFGQSTQPTTSQLMPVIDNSDPLKMTLGNPYLKPYFSHNARGSYRYTNKQNFVSVNAFFGGGAVQDAIINTTWYDNNGVQYSIPLNGPTTGNANLRCMVNAPIAKSKFSIFSMTNFRFTNGDSYIIRDGKYVVMNSYFDDPSNPKLFNYARFNEEVIQAGKLGDIFKTNVTNTLRFVERLRLTFRNDLVEITAGARTQMNKTWYSVSKSSESLTWNNQVETTMNWTIPGGVGLVAEYNYNWYNGYAQGNQIEPSHILNVEISKLLFKNKFTLALKGYDLIGQSRNISISDTDNYHMETSNNTLGRYIILSLTYRFGNFNNAKSQFEKGGGYGRGPMGRGPGM